MKRCNFSSVFSQDVDFDLVKVGCLRAFHSLVNGHGAIWLHINFLAKLKGSSSNEEQLFFAEIKSFYREYMVNVAVMVDRHNAGNHCRLTCGMTGDYCGSKIVHPPNGVVEAGYHRVYWGWLSQSQLL